MNIVNSKPILWKVLSFGVIAIFVFNSGILKQTNEVDQFNSAIPVSHASFVTTTAPATFAEINEELPPPQSYSPMVFETSYANAAKKATPAIVTVAASKMVKQRSMNPFDFFRERGSRGQGQEEEYEARQAGSGVIISKDGYIVTNNHVVQGVQEVTVTLEDKRTYEAKIIGTDPLTDIALIKIESENDLPVIEFGDSKKIFIGQHVLAIGNPLSIGTTVTSGIISALNRNINILQDSYSIEKFIQTDAAINPGNSGGALVDLSGNLVGINTAIASATGYYSGYGFAVPSQIVSHVVNEIKEHGKVKRGYIGIQLGEVSYKIAKEKGFNSPKGVYVGRVLPDMPGSEAGIEQDDIILSVDGVEVNEPNMLQAEVSSKKYNAKVKIQVHREGKILTKTLQLRERPDEPNAVVLASSESKLNQLGVAVRPLSEFKANQLDIDYGIEVSNVKKYSEAFRNNIKEGDVILKIGRTKLKKTSELSDYLKNLEPGDTVKLFIQPADGSFKRYVYLEIPN